jgi:hypothetical protein
MKEIRVYVVNAGELQGVYAPDLSNEEFVSVAEFQGNVYSLKVFEMSINFDLLELSNAFIRFIEVECSESIDFEEWRIPKLNEVTDN